MGRTHPVGIVLAAILFGALYQGGAELAFEMPNITRDMIVVIQGLVILFSGALEHMFAAAGRSAASPVAAAGGCSGRRDGRLRCRPRRPRRSTRPCASPRRCCWPRLAGLFSERAGIFDIGLEGKMLAGAFAAAAAAAVTGSAWLGLAAGIIAAVVLALLHGFASITHRGNQVVSRRGASTSSPPASPSCSATPGSGRAARRRAAADARFGRSSCPAPTRCATCRSSARSMPNSVRPQHPGLCRAALRCRSPGGCVVPHALRPAAARGRREPRAPSTRPASRSPGCATAP